MYNILVSNDDGIFAEGIKQLVRSLGRFADVYVAAPKNQQSAKSMAITVSGLITAEKVEMDGAKAAYAVNGSPADSVKYGIMKCLEDNIILDYVIGGINMGANLGIDVNYSGTVACALEGALSGYKAIALSVDRHEASHFDYICSLLPELLKLSDQIGKDSVLSVNAPDTPASEVKGLKFCPCDGSDISLLLDGYATVTPIVTKRTDISALSRIHNGDISDMLCLFIDFQERLMPAMSREKELAIKVSKFARSAKALGIPCMLTQQYTKGLGPTIENVTKELGSEFTEKLSFDCMGSEEFRNRLAKFKRNTVIVAGIETHICVQQTVLSLLKAGYSVELLRDCCSSRFEEDKLAALELMARAGCRVTTYEAFVYRLLGSSGHEQFKTISKIVTE